MENAEKYGWRPLTSAAYALARRPRGQQFLRQVDRVMDVIERVVRWITGGGGGLSSSSGYFPVSVVTMLMLLLIVLPSFLLCTFILSIFLLPFMLPVLVLAPFRKAKQEGTSDTFRSVFTTPHLMATFINRKRRTMRAIRLDGIREMQSSETLLQPDSIVSKLFIWWPVAVLATFGNFIGLGGPYTPTFFSSSPFEEMFAMSPRKRKLHQLQGSSDEEYESADSEDEMLEESSSVEPELIIPSDTTLTTIIRRLSGTIEALNSSANPDELSDENSDPDYQPGFAETDCEELEVEDEENESDVEGENENPADDGKTEFLGENIPTPEEDIETVELKGEATVTPSITSVPSEENNILSKGALGDELTEPAVMEPKVDHVDQISSPSLDIPEERLLTERGKDTIGTQRKAAEESLLFLQAEADSSGLVAPGQESAEIFVAEYHQKKENIRVEGIGKVQSEIKDSSKSKPRFSGLFRRGSDK